MKPFIATIRQNGKSKTSLFQVSDDFHAATFCLETEVEAVVPLKVSGRTYADRKASARQTAIDYQAADVGGLSYGELFDIQEFFVAVARRYGLVQEFRENGII